MKLTVLIIVCAWLVAFVGWIMNIVALISTLMIPGALVITGMMVARTIGIFFAPLGAILGFF
jgi:nucleoside permease NupC